MLADFYAYLKNDTALATLLGGTAGDPRIYPDIAPDSKTPPYLVYSVNTDGGYDELLSDVVINLSIYSESATLNANIVSRLKTILDKQDQIAIPSTGYRMFWCKQISGSTLYEPDTRLYHRVVLFALKHIKKGE